MRTRSYDAFDVIEKMCVGMVVSLVFAAGVFVACIFGAVFGALAGWAVSWIFPEAIIRTVARFGVNTAGLQMWELGAMLGFVGGFLKTTVNKSD